MTHPDGGRARLVRALYAAAVMAACAVGDQVDPGDSITQLLVVPDTISLSASQQVQYHAFGRTTAGDTVPVAVRWSASGGAIDTGGWYVAGDSAGTYLVSAALSDPALTATGTIRNRGLLQAVVLTPPAVAVPPGGVTQFSAYGVAANGDSVVVTPTFAASGGTIDETGFYIAGTTTGSYQVTVTAQLHPSHNPVADTAQVSIDSGAPIPIVSVQVAPASASVMVGATVQLTATPKDASGNPLTGRPITWTTGSAATATVSASGLVSGVAEGMTTITATAEGKSGTAQVTVQSPPPIPVAIVEVTPASATVAVNATVQLTATPKDANGNPLTGRPVTWTTSNATLATVSASGLVTGKAVGLATITATAESKSGTAAITVVAPPGGVVLVGAGDIADCGSTGDEATAILLDGIPGTVFTAGDNAYSDGSATDYTNCYEPTWGRHKARTRPSPGNHEYNTTGAADYFAYFGSAAGPAGLGYYSYDLGAWHIISLNSEVDMSAGSAQETWLRVDLAASTKQCTLAYWHKPLFSSGTKHGSMVETQPLWQALYDYGAEIVIAGHDHDYERFAPQTSSGTADPARGIREFVVGTGGSSNSDVGTLLPNSEASNGTTFGVLKLTLGSGSYTWQFVPIAGQTFTDSGSGSCH